MATTIWHQLGRTGNALRIFTSTPFRTYAQKIRPLPQIDENDIEETFVRGSGPGGRYNPCITFLIKMD